MWPDQVSNPGPLTYESGALPTALRGPAKLNEFHTVKRWMDDMGLLRPFQQRFSHIRTMGR